MQIHNFELYFNFRLKFSVLFKASLVCFKSVLRVSSRKYIQNLNEELK